MGSVGFLSFFGKGEGMNIKGEAKRITEKLSINEKIRLLAGKDNWHFYGVGAEGVPNILVTDGPHGLRKKVGCYPPACTSVC